MTWTMKTAPRPMALAAESALSLESLISVAEESMERGSLDGREWRIPSGREFDDGVWDPGYSAATRDVHVFIRGAIRSQGVDGDHVRVVLDSSGRGGAIASTDGRNSITVTNGRVSSMTLLHECAHIVQRSRGGSGHTAQFVEIATALYSEYISRAAADQFSKIMTMSGKTAASNVDHSTSVMVALVPCAATIEAFTAMAECTEPAEELHLTLAYLGDIDDCDGEDGKDRILRNLASFAHHAVPPEGRPNGFGVFQNEEDVLVALWDIPNISEFREGVVEAIDTAIVRRTDNHGFTPHMTIQWGESEISKIPRVPEVEPEVFDSVYLVWGSQWIETPLRLAHSVGSATY